MTQADRVFSTPPTNTSVTRRNMLVAITAAVAALPIAAAMPANAEQSADPIFAIIDEHQAATATWKEAVRVEFAYQKCRPEIEAMDPVERETYQSTFDSLQEATEDASDQMHNASVDLLNNPPSSLAGVIALCEYVGPQLDDDEHNLPDEIEWEDGTQSTPSGAFANAIRIAVADIGKAMSVASKAVV